jgi:hypothetical protein
MNDRAVNEKVFPPRADCQRNQPLKAKTQTHGQRSRTGTAKVPAMMKAIEKTLAATAHATELAGRCWRTATTGSKAVTTKSL